MRSYTTVAVLALPSLALAASLSDFKPYVDDLPTACEAVYKSQIPGCKNSDFTDGRGCSTACISGLNAMVPAVQLACGSAGISGNNVLSAFLAGNGVYQLCPNSPSQAASTSSAAPSTTSTPPTTTSETPTSTSETPTTTSTTEASSTSTTQSTSSAAAVTTSSSSSSSTSSKSTARTTSSPGSSTTTSSSGSSTSSQAASRTGGNNSGGGSPFDSTGAASGVAAQLEQVLVAAVLGAFALLR